MASTSRQSPVRSSSSLSTLSQRVASHRQSTANRKRIRSASVSDDSEPRDQRPIKVVRRAQNHTGTDDRSPKSSSSSNDVDTGESSTLDTDGDEEEGDNSAGRSERVSAIRQGKKRMIEEVDQDSVAAWKSRRPRGGTKRARRGSVEENRTGSSGDEEEEPAKPMAKRYISKYTKSPAKPPRSEETVIAKQEPRDDRDREVGEKWTDSSGVQWRKRSDGVVVRLAVLAEKRKKYKMPGDSEHPDARAM